MTASMEMKVKVIDFLSLLLLHPRYPPRHPPPPPPPPDREKQAHDPAPRPSSPSSWRGRVWRVCVTLLPLHRGRSRNRSDSTTTTRVRMSGMEPCVGRRMKRGTLDEI